jgi:hypothetical protein
LLQKLQYHSSFEKEFNQTVILAAYFCKKFELIENFQLNENHKNKFIKFSSSPEVVLTECIVVCENAELKKFILQCKQSQNLNETQQIINLVLDKISIDALNLDHSKEILLGTKTILLSANSENAYSDATDYIRNFKKTAA